jgi:hypothetical protein
MKETRFETCAGNARALAYMPGLRRGEAGGGGVQRARSGASGRWRERGRSGGKGNRGEERGPELIRNDHPEINYWWVVGDETCGRR